MKKDKKWLLLKSLSLVDSWDIAEAFLIPNFPGLEVPVMKYPNFLNELQIEMLEFVICVIIAILQ